MYELEKAQLTFLDAIERQLVEIKAVQKTMVETLSPMQKNLGRRKKFKMIPDRNSKTHLIQEVVLIEEPPEPTPDPTVLTKKKAH